MKSDLSDLQRFKKKDLPGDNGDDINGVYVFRSNEKTRLQVTAARHRGWEHVMVMAIDIEKRHGKRHETLREPSFAEVRLVQRHFFEEGERPVIFPAYSNDEKTPNVHLWIPQEFTMPHPDGSGDRPGAVDIPVQ